ncbi:hypothetical protein [Vreelandella neptunia]|uniref:hypothetical protein n=1 Tax=Vreelandella neptunia TaxID=115551 RepID=UPI00315B3476
MRLSYIIFFFSVIITVLIIAYLNSSTAFYCGIREDKPELSLGLSPSWFDDRFQLMIGHTDIISSTNKNEPVFDKWVKGVEKFKTIVKYNATSQGSKLYFKAINWEGDEQLFSLRRYSSEEDKEYAFEVSPEEKFEQEEKWVSVDLFQCIRGKYLGYTLIALFILIITNIVLILRLISRFIKRHIS